MQLLLPGWGQAACMTAAPQMGAGFPWGCCSWIVVVTHAATTPQMVARCFQAATPRMAGWQAIQVAAAPQAGAGCAGLHSSDMGKPIAGCCSSDGGGLLM